jgi:hypothetical protein
MNSEPFDPRSRTHLRNTLCLRCFGRSPSVVLPIPIVTSCYR